MIARRSTEEKLELTLIGIFLCLLSFHTFTRTSLYTWLEGLLSPFMWFGISSSIILLIALVSLISSLTLRSVLYDNPSRSKPLFYLALLFFIPTALAYSAFDWPILSILHWLTNEVSVTETLMVGVSVVCGILLYNCYLEYIGIKEELYQRGISEQLKKSYARRLNLILGMTQIVFSGIAAFIVGYASILIMNSFKLLSKIETWEIVGMLVISIVLIYSSLWYLAKTRNI